MLLSRVAERIYWAARYSERAEDMARIVRSYTTVVADLRGDRKLRWDPLVAVAGSGVRYRRDEGQTEEAAVVNHLVADRSNPGSLVSSISAARENLRTTREVFPREAWQALNNLYLYVGSESQRGVDRRQRDRFLQRVVGDSRRFDGILATSMRRDEAFAMWRLGRSIERADMTSRVIGVRAADVLSTPHSATDDDEVQWMGVLRSLSGWQVYQRTVRKPIEGPAVVNFLLDDKSFPRTVRFSLGEVRKALLGLPRPGRPLVALEEALDVLDGANDTADDPRRLDEAMDELQRTLGDLNDAIVGRYLRLDR